MQIIESPEVNLSICGQLIFDKGTKAFNGERTLFNGSATTVGLASPQRQNELKMNHTPKYKNESYKAFKQKHKRKLFMTLS